MLLVTLSKWSPIWIGLNWHLCSSTRVCLYVDYHSFLPRFCHYSMNIVLIFGTVLLLSSSLVEGYLRKSRTTPPPPPTCDLTRDALDKPLNSRNGWKNGKFKKSQTASTPTCPLPSPIDCKWSTWSTWSACSITCGGILGMESRTREISNTAYYGGMDCQGDSSENKSCIFEDPCQGIVLWWCATITFPPYYRGEGFHCGPELKSTPIEMHFGFW